MTNPQTAPAPLWQTEITTAGGAYVTDRARAVAVVAALTDAAPRQIADAIQDSDGGAAWGVWDVPLPGTYGELADAALADPDTSEAAWSVLVGGIRYLITVPLP